MKQTSEFSKTYYVTPGLCNARRELPLSHLVSDVIELATEHANRLGIGFKYMTPKGLGWVLSRLSVEMIRFPKFAEHFTLTTWVEEWNRHFSMRNFMIESQTGEVLGYIRTIWMVIDLNSHTGVGTSVLPFDSSLLSERPCPIEPLKRIHHIEPITINEYTFKYTDLDFYEHVNTVKYVELLLNQFPLSRFENSFIRRIDLAFRHEARFGETALIEISSPEQNKYGIRLRKDDNILLESQILFS